MILVEGNAVFDDVCRPLKGKNEFGVDTLVRKVKGDRALAEAYIAALAQVLAFELAGSTYYLQTWDPDDDPVWATITLTYKGLLNGTPPPDIQTEIVSAAGTTSSSFALENNGLGRPYRKDLLWTLTNSIPTDSLDSGIVGTGIRTRYTTGATMQFTYRAVQSRYRYVRIGKPSGPIYAHIDVPVPAIELDQVRIVLSDGVVYGRESIAEFALQPTGRERVISFSSQHVIGTPYYECEDVVRYQLEDDTI